MAGGLGVLREGSRGAQRTAGTGEAGAEAGSEPSRQKKELAAGKPGLDSRGRGGENRGGESLAGWISRKERRENRDAGVELRARRDWQDLSFLKSLAP